MFETVDLGLYNCFDIAICVTPAFTSSITANLIVIVTFFLPFLVPMFASARRCQTALHWISWIKIEIMQSCILFIFHYGSVRELRCSTILSPLYVLFFTFKIGYFFTGLYHRYKIAHKLRLWQAFNFICCGSSGTAKLDNTGKKFLIVCLDRSCGERNLGFSEWWNRL